MSTYAIDSHNGGNTIVVVINVLDVVHIPGGGGVVGMGSGGTIAMYEKVQ